MRFAIRNCQGIFIGVKRVIVLSKIDLAKSLGVMESRVVDVRIDRVESDYLSVFIRVHLWYSLSILIDKFVYSNT